MWLRCSLAVPSLRNDMIRDMIEWVPAVVHFGVKHMEPFGCWESTKSFTLSPVNSHKLLQKEL